MGFSSAKILIVDESERPRKQKKHSDRWLNGKSNHHFAAGSIAGIYSDLPSEPLYDDAADVQAKSGARFEVIYFGETFEHPFLLVGRDADAFVLNRDPDAVPAPGDPQIDPALGGAVFQAVVHKNAQNLLH